MNSVIRFALNRLPRIASSGDDYLGRRLGILRETDEFKLRRRLRRASVRGDGVIKSQRSVANLMFAPRRNRDAFACRRSREGEGTRPQVGPAQRGATPPQSSMRPEETPRQPGFRNCKPTRTLDPPFSSSSPSFCGARVALTVVGRQRVVNFLARLLARLISRFVGPSSNHLSRHWSTLSSLLAAKTEAEAAPNETGPRGSPDTLKELSVRRLTTCLRQLSIRNQPEPGTAEGSGNAGNRGLLPVGDRAHSGPAARQPTTRRTRDDAGNGGRGGRLGLPSAAAL